jgi:hypothetical protein
MTEHTPGPWHQSATLISTVATPIRVIAELSEPEPPHWVEHHSIELGSKNWNEAMANGQLIALAPELEASLSLLLRTVNDTLRHGLTPGQYEALEAAGKESAELLKRVKP